MEIGTRHDGERVEQDPLEILASVETALAELDSRGGGFDALGLCTQRSSCLLWERSTGAPLSPVISWQDRRHHAEARELGPLLGELVRRSSGLFLSPHYSALKLAGLLDAGPGLRQRAAAGDLVAGTLDAWLVHRLTGEPSTEPGQAGRTLLYDLAGGAWADELCERLRVPKAALPALRPSAGERGRWRGVPLVGLLGDQQAALLGHGGWQPGVVAAHVGTGAFVLAATGFEIRRHPGLLSAVLASTASERRFQIEGTVQSAGSAVDWACRIAGVSLAALPAEPLDVETLPVVVPALVGLGAPWWRPEARAAILDLEPAAEGATLVRATLAGVAQRIADNVEAMREAGVAVGALRLSGALGGRRDFAQAIAELAGCEVQVVGEEAGLGGLARWLAVVLAGSFEHAPPAPVAVLSPSWSTRRRATARRRWLEALERVV